MRPPNTVESLGIVWVSVPYFKYNAFKILPALQVFKLQSVKS